MDLEDIEDISGQQDDGTRITRDLPPQVARGQRHAKSLAEPCYAADEDSACAQPGDLPGLGSVWVKTFGCSHNISDSEYMAGQLQDYGYRCEVLLG